MNWDWRAARDRRSIAASVAVPGIGPLLHDATYACVFCRGKGEKQAGAICPVCRGSGVVSLEPPVVKCGYCRGRGEIPARSGITCTVCRGQGKVSVHEPIEACPSCRGRGRKVGSALHCIECRGVGVVSASAGTDRSSRALADAGDLCGKGVVREAHR